MRSEQEKQINSLHFNTILPQFGTKSNNWVTGKPYIINKLLESQLIPSTVSIS